MADVMGAGLGRRLGALLYDSVLVVALWLTVTIVHLAFFRLVLGQPVEAVGASALSVWSLRALLLVSVTFFFCFFWSRSGMTLGMQAWHLRVQAPNGQKITLKQGLVRCVTAWFSLAALGMGYGWVLVDKQRRSWPDIASHTCTVIVPKRQETSD
ncbi:MULTISPECIES: RDD family protein [Halomonas]|uniref:RDD family protein n=1 Tax=Halomonas TaxID=2745 RepID=UPI001865DE3B|nr:RDD family protein [Halomonas citrativorans]